MRMSLGAMAGVVMMAAFCAGCARGRGDAGVADGAGALRVIVVRHGERAEDGSDDPGLTESGRAWARELAGYCVARGVTGVVATPYRRTMETAWPAAEAVGVPVRAVPVSGGMEAHVESIARLVEGVGGGCWLVVGHSNTVPAIVGRLAGVDASGFAIGESAYGVVFELWRLRDGGWAVRRGGLDGGRFLDSPGVGDGV